MFSTNQLEVIHYCALECARQGSGEGSVYNMVNAWDYASLLDSRVGLGSDYGKLTLDIIERIGTLVDPIKNQKGFRTIPIYVGNAFYSVEKAPWDRVRELLTALIEAYYGNRFAPDLGELGQEAFGQHPLAKTAEDQFYFEYENIHPFVDGNGRSGKVIYNYLCGTLGNPKLPPNFWNTLNP